MSQKILGNATRFLVLSIFGKFHWISRAREETKHLEANMEKRSKENLLEEILENISRRQFIEHCRGTRWTCRRLQRLFELLRRRGNRHFRRGVFAGVGNDAGIRHRILHRVSW